MIKMEEEFNLSDKTHWFYDGEGNEEDWYKDKDVKEFIRRLKEEIRFSTGTMEREDVIFLIDTLVGEKLTNHISDDNILFAPADAQTKQAEKKE